MAKELKYPVRRTARLSEATDKLLQKKAKTMGLEIAVCLRIIVEHSLTGEPITVKGKK